MFNRFLKGASFYDTEVFFYRELIPPVYFELCSLFSDSKIVEIKNGASAEFERCDETKRRKESSRGDN